MRQVRDAGVAEVRDLLENGWVKWWQQDPAGWRAPLGMCRPPWAPCSLNLKQSDKQDW